MHTRTGSRYFVRADEVPPHHPANQSYVREQALGWGKLVRAAQIEPE